MRGDEKLEVSAADLEKYGIKSDAVSALNDDKTGIPDYWPKVIKNAKYFVVNEKDEEILKNLIDIRLTYGEGMNFFVEFEFKPNDYFTNTVLKKEYFYLEDRSVDRAESTQVNWTSPDKNPAKKKVTKKVKKGNKIETKLQENDVDSFFDLFKNEKGEVIMQDEPEFIREELLQDALEYYLDIHPSEHFGEEDEDEEDEDDDDGKPKGKKGGKPNVTEEVK